MSNNNLSKDIKKTQLSRSHGANFIFFFYRLSLYYISLGERKIADFTFKFSNYYFKQIWCIRSIV